MLEEVRAVAQALQENKDLTTLMNHPKIDKENKIQLIENIFKGQVSDELVGLMRMIVEKDHYRELPGVFAYFIDRVKEYRNIGTAYVTSAVELSAAQREAVEKKLLATTKYVQFEMHYDVDAGLIGGMVIRIGDRVVDSSIKTKLYGLTRELSQIQLKVGECAP
jgi:F-type H+-transporting ATPase subunit delta